MTANTRSYDFAVKPDNYYAHARPEMFGFVPKKAKAVLDVGCGEGWFGRAIKEQLQAEVWGVEMAPEAAAAAEHNLDRVLVGDINALIGALPDRRFDCVIFNDVLEHLADPYTLLVRIKKKLTADGVVVCSLPNVRYWRNLKHLLIDKQWRYEDSGVLDKTHLRFFTKKSIEEMFAKLGYDLLRIEGINNTRSLAFRLLNAATIGALSDARPLQFACLARPNGASENNARF